MRYLNILFIEYNDGTKDKKAMYDAETELDCLAKHHSLLGTNMVAENVKHVLSIAVDTTNGYVIAMENFNKEGES